MTTAPMLILASTSRYRRALLTRLHLPFETHPPEVDETPWAGETPVALVQRLSLAKARAIASRHPTALVIGSDQVAELDGSVIGKPGTHARAVTQLRLMSGRVVTFLTGLAVVCEATGYLGQALVPTRVQFRALDDISIENYLKLEQPYDCAGSAKSEGLGISLLESLESDDPTALIGLPLIRTCELLRAAGVDPLWYSKQ